MEAIAEIKELLENHIIPDDKLLTVEQVSDTLGVCKDKVWKLNRADQIPKPVKVNGSTRWKKSQIQEYIKGLS